MYRLLAVSPHFPPVNAPDSHRLRISLPHYKDSGWEPRVLACLPDADSQNLEPELLATLPADLPVNRVRAWSPRLTRRVGLGHLGWRALSALARTGDRIVEQWRPDLVFFSTTQFPAMLLGARWKRRFGVPYVVDWQDPLVSDFYDRPGAPPPPGGWKYRVARRVAAWLEPRCLRESAGLLSVSPAYPEALAKRCPWFAARPALVLPFGVSTGDLVRARAEPLAPPPGERPAIVYTGRLGGDMTEALTGLFRAVGRMREETGRAPHLHFFGSSYAAPGTTRPVTPPLAAATGATGLVHETAGRIGYLESLRRLAGADALLLLGSADRTYAPSKLHTVLALEKPTLAFVPPHSVVYDAILDAAAGVRMVELNEQAAVSALQALVRGEVPPVRFNPSAHRLDGASLARLQADFFRRCISAP